ncbi:MAG: multifunctional oxoglutarate decarboxylase/oxoglutarate dehydrogenase thiamine pyrophosphate-binding subunit/dihydrolipoyllysine-residue succinyltransferase subunit [Candidatus Eremiobacteraeota bacterium]|nr:multifunctional oxoglutarate decarboxylase/oxoglutarate dehydrogenase thiamine pyrophosphate-binding subunit/dihydrolipoyllysine-residue succinyltransferase subunit [Candidatus Eremiobacteraeota bacterium]
MWALKADFVPTIDVLLPEMGESVAEGSVTSWRKKPGDAVAAGEPLVDVTTDKVDVEVPSPAGGTLTKILVEEGATVKVGAKLAEIDPAGGDGATTSAAPAAPQAAASAPSAAALAAPTPNNAPAPSASATTQAATQPTAPADGGPFVSPLARRMAAIHDVKLGDVQPAYPQAPVRRSDITRAIDGAAQTPAPATAQPRGAVPGERTTRLRGAAASLADHMERSLTIPTATSFRTISVDVLDTRRRELNAALRAGGRSEKISFTHILAYAIAQATRAVPAMATSFRRADDGPERVERGVHLGLAVDVKRADGSRMLVVPVVRDADRLDFVAFYRAYEALVEKARASTLTPGDLAGATLTLTNPGGIGTVASVPRLMHGQGTIVAAGAIGYPPGLGSLPEATLRSLGVQKTMTLTSTYDHRIIQGAESGEFLRRIDQLLSGADGFYEAIFAALAVGAPPAHAQAPAPRPQATGEPAAADVARAAAAGMGLVMRYRTHGVNAARLDPLADASPFDTALEPSSLGLDHALMERVPASALRIYAPAQTMVDVLHRLRDTYCSTIAYEVEHISNHEQRSWLRQQIESGAHRQPLSRERKLELLERLTRVESFERYLRKAFLGQKTFSIEGLDAMVPMLEEMLHVLADEGTAEVRLGMAHRGRLAVITHVVDRPYEEILLEFEHAQERGFVRGEGDVTGDVKYHQGATGTYETESGKKIRVVLANNPSHLEAVDSVVEGQTRAVQTDRRHNIAVQDTSRAAAILIHGDAAFAGQGVVAEVFNMQGLAGYTTGGTLHIIANNQIGFTTPPSEGRSTRYASDLAKGFDVPIIHVNADDIEAAIAAVHLAVEYRRRFHRDALIDLIGYRRFGHNEADEPAYTQPDMYERIAKHPTARDIFARRLIEEGTITDTEAKASLERAQNRVAEAHATAKAAKAPSAHNEPKARHLETNGEASVETAVALDTLRSLNAQLVAVPNDFTIHAKLKRQLERRADALEPAGEIDWGLAEALAFGSLLREGVPIRVTGQDTERGTFSHRHLVLHDAHTGQPWTPMQHLRDAKASFEIHNSPLSEYAAMGFEYGYSAEAPEALVLWEAQFGDFSNGGQIIIDQFIAAGRAKWQQTSRLTLLLPHGYEGAGPEHSSARLERYLLLAAEGNLRIANPTTPAQYFHLLRDQARSSRARPLVIMTPKSLLRLHAASSHGEELATGRFQPVLDDPMVKDRATVQHVALCSGKLYYDLSGHAQRERAGDLAIVRVELLEPFPYDRVMAIVGAYPNVKRVTWVQEEPKNMGARAFVSRRIRETLTPRGILFDYVGRPDRASPSEGYPGAHAVEQERIVNEVVATDTGRT